MGLSRKPPNGPDAGIDKNCNYCYSINMSDQDNREGPVPLGDLLMPDISGSFKWLGSAAIDRRLRKSTTEVDVDQLREERKYLIEQIGEAGLPGAQELAEELRNTTYLLLSAEADLIDQRRVNNNIS